MKKRGQEAEFNWIFILVAGVIILGFFSVFIFKYIELQNKKASFEIVRNLNTQLELLEVGPGAFGEKLINLGLVSKVNFSCVGDKSLAVVNDQQDLAYNLGDKIVFAPDSVRDKTFGLWIYDWSYPFLVTKFLYLTSSRFKYIIVGQAPEALSKIPENVFDIEYVPSVTDIKDPGNTKVVFFTENNNWDELLNKYPGLEVIYIDTTNKRVLFYEKGESLEPLEYYGDAFLYGAIFAGNYENYKCALNNGLKRLGYVSRVYSRKGYLLSSTSSQECRYSILDSGLKFFENYKGAGGMDQNMERLKEQNMEVHGMGCPALF